MRRRLAILAALLAMPGTAAAQALEDLPPAVRAQVEEAVRSRAVGRYAYRDDELAASVDLRADGSFDYRAEGIGPPVPDEGRFGFAVAGRWSVAGPDRLLLRNTATTPPSMTVARRWTDPAGGARLLVKDADGGQTVGLGILVDDGADGALYALTATEWDLGDVVAADDGKPHRIEIVRTADSLSLLRLDLRPGGPNRFALTYTPSPVDIFRLAAAIDPADPDTLEVEFGSASLTLARLDQNARSPATLPAGR